MTVSADGRTVSLSSENVTKFQKIGKDADNKDFSLGMGEILSSSQTVEFRIADKFTNKHGKEFSTSTTLIPGGITIGKEESSTGNIQILVNPRAGEAATNFDNLNLEDEAMMESLSFPLMKWSIHTLGKPFLTF